MNTTTVKQWILLFVLTATVSGCAFTTAQVNLAYKPEAAQKSPLSTIKPLVFAIQIDDQRDTNERDRVGNKRNGFGAITASVKTNQDVTLVLQEALKTELENNGHNIRPPKEANLNATVHVLLKKYWSDLTIRFFEIQMVGTINADVEVLDAQNERIVSKPISSTYTESRQIATDGAFESVLNGALLEFIRNFARDPSIVNALQGMQREKIADVFSPPADGGIRTEESPESRDHT